jgi:hypothetical protein
MAASGGRYTGAIGMPEGEAFSSGEDMRQSYNAGFVLPYGAGRTGEVVSRRRYYHRSPYLENPMEQVPKYRNMFVQVVLFFITCGIYGIYWFYQTASELKQIARDPNASPALWTLLTIIPLVNLYAFYRYSELFDSATGEKLPWWAVFLLFIVCAPAVWLVVQLELNRMADEVLRARAYAT